METAGSPYNPIPVLPEHAIQLSLLLRGPSGEEQTVKCRRVVTLLGSKPGCKIQLKHPYISGIHLAFVNTGQKIIAVDLVTQNGTILNGLRMQHETIRDGDLFLVEPWEATARLKAPPRHAMRNEPPLDPTPEGIALVHLGSGKVLRPKREVCLIGRRGGCDVSVADGSMSRVHTLLFLFENRPVICDVLSENGILVNDRPVAFRSLEHEDVLTIGESRFRVHLVGMPNAGSGSTGGIGAKVTGSTSTTIKLNPNVRDLINIAETEQSQRWRIAESFSGTKNKS